MNGDTICLNGNRLIDGQHRLSAVVMSGVSIQSFVVEGLTDDVFDTKDIGKRRSHAETLATKGEKNTSRLAAALMLVDKYITGRSDKQVCYTNMEIQELLEKYPGVRESAAANYRARGLAYLSVIDACHYLFSQKDPDLANEFVDKVMRGTGLEEGSPWYALRERLVSNSLLKSKMPRPDMMALCIKAWNATRAGTQIRVLRWNDRGQFAEAFPIIR